MIREKSVSVEVMGQEGWEEPSPEKEKDGVPHVVL